MVKTNDLVPGDIVRLVDFGMTPRLYRAQLQALGVHRGAVVSVVRKAPLGCPIAFKIYEMIFMLRVHEAEWLVWEYV